MQEALTNVVKHARTSSCRVLLGYRDDELTIEVSDDGAGAAIPDGARPGHRSTRPPRRPAAACCWKPAWTC